MDSSNDATNDHNATNNSSHQTNGNGNGSDSESSPPSSPARVVSHPDSSTLDNNQMDSKPPPSDDTDFTGMGSSSENVSEKDQPDRGGSTTNNNAMPRTQDMTAMLGNICQTTNSGSIPSDSSATFPASSSADATSQQVPGKRSNDADEEDAQQEQAAKRQKIEPIQFKPVPPSKEGIKFYSRNDVLCGRGGGTNVHPGNRKFRDLINANRRAYLKARKNDKPAISRSIVRTIRENNGRFLKKEEKLGMWFEIGDDSAREKTSQALRQRAPEMRKILFEDEQRQVQEQLRNSMMMGLNHNGMGMNQLGMMMGMNPNQMNMMNNSNSMPNQFMMNQMAMMQSGMMPNMMNLGMANMMFSQGAQGLNSAQGPQPLEDSSKSQASKGSNTNEELALLAKYNALTQNKFLQEKNTLLQRLAMAGVDPTQFQQRTASIEQMQTEALLGGEMKPVTPRGA